jgi:hypothetical protein
MLCSGCDERTHIHIPMYLFFSKPCTLTRLSRVARSAGTVERVHTAPARSPMTAWIHTAGLQHFNALKFKCVSSVKRHKLYLEEFRFGNTLFSCLCPQIVSKIKSNLFLWELFSVVYNVRYWNHRFLFECQQIAHGFNFSYIIKHKNAQSKIPLITWEG